MGNSTVTDFLIGTDVIGFLDGAGAGAVQLGGTTAITAGATLNVTDFAAITATDGTGLQTSHVNVATVAFTAAQIAGVELDFDTAYLVVFNSTAGVGQIWYDADWDTVGDRFQVATLTGTTAAQIAALNNTNFVGFEV